MKIYFNPARTHCILDELPPDGDTHTEIMEVEGGFDVPGEDDQPVVYVNSAGNVFLTIPPEDLEVVANADLKEVFSQLEAE